MCKTLQFFDLLFVRYFFIICGERILRCVMSISSCSLMKLLKELPPIYLPKTEPQGEWSDSATSEADALQQVL